MNAPLPEWGLRPRSNARQIRTHAPGIGGMLRPNLTQCGGRGDLARRLDEHERKIVGGHLDHLAERKPVICGFADEVVDIADAPALVASLEVCVEGGVRGRRVRATPHEGAVEIENSVL